MNRAAAATAAITNASFDDVERIRREFKVAIQVDETNPLRVEQARLAVGILGRTFAQVRIQGVANPATLGHIATLRGTVESGPLDADIVVNFGGPQPTKPHVHADHQGWAAALSTTAAPGSSGNNVLAALYASALACQHAFNTAFKSLIPQANLLDGDATWDLATGQEGATPPDTPEIQPVGVNLTIVGVGAVGQAIVHAFSVLPNLAGCIELVDHEFIDAGNTERYLLARPDHIGQYKPQVARTILAHAHPLLRVTYPAPAGQYPMADQVPPPIEWTNRHALAASAGSPGWPITPRMFIEYLAPPLTYLGWREMDGTTPRRLVVAAVDSAVTRRDIQFGLHKHVLNVWTDSGEARNTWGYSFHAIGNRQCMACQYHEPVDDPGSALDFKARQVGWPTERVRSHLENPTKVLTQEDLTDLQRQKGLSPQHLQQYLGKPLKRFIEGLCGQGAAVGNDRVSPPPVPHVPAIVGIHAVAAIILREMGHKTPDKVQGDSLRAPAISLAIPLSPAAKGCLCQHASIQSWYEGYWKLQDALLGAVPALGAGSAKKEETNR